MYEIHHCGLEEACHIRIAQQGTAAEAKAMILEAEASDGLGGVANSSIGSTPASCGSLAARR